MKIKRVCSIAGGFLVLSLVGCGTEPGGNTRGTSGAAPRTGETAAKRERFEGFSFELPSGWTRVAPDRDNTKALLVLGKDREKAKAMIKIDVGPPGSPNPKDIAETLGMIVAARCNRNQSIWMEYEPFRCWYPLQPLAVPRRRSSSFVAARST